MKRIALVALSVLALAGCSANPGTHKVGRGELESLIRARGLEPTHLVVPYRLTPEMKRWVHEVVPKSADAEDGIGRLTRALFSDDVGIEYARGYTGTATEVFESGEANCLAFTHLFVGMAREVGIHAYFLEVRDIEKYRKDGDLIVVSDHVAVGYGPSHDMHIIDFADASGAEYRRLSIADDYRAIAMFYSNRGAEELRLARYDEALNWLRSAVAIDPGYSASWVNMGVALRRSGNLDGAEAAYRVALEMDLHSSSALQNLAAVLTLRGQDEEAFELLEMADKSSNRNPFTYLSLGDLSMRRGRYEDASRFYRKALRRQGKNAESLAAMGLLSFRQGELKKAHSWLRRAESLDPESSRVALLKGRLDADAGEV